MLSLYGVLEPLSKYINQNKNKSKKRKFRVKKENSCSLSGSQIISETA